MGKKEKEFLRKEILPGFFVGTISDATDEEFIFDESITHILVVLDAIPKTELALLNKWRIPYLHLALSEKSKENILQNIDLVCEWIHKARLSDGKILVHCSNGRSRSIAIIIAYILSVTRLSEWRILLAALQLSSFDASPNENYSQQLDDFQSSEQLTNLKSSLSSITTSGDTTSSSSLTSTNNKSAVDNNEAIDNETSVPTNAPDPPSTKRNKTTINSTTTTATTPNSPRKKAKTNSLYIERKFSFNEEVSSYMADELELRVNDEKFLVNLLTKARQELAQSGAHSNSPTQQHPVEPQLQLITNQISLLS